MLRAALTSALLVATVGCATLPPPATTQASLAFWIEEIAGPIDGSHDVIEFEYDGVAIACISDEAFDRMRLVAPIAKRSDVDPRALAAMLTANFHTTLDGRYAMSDGILFAAYLHPLSTLAPDELESAIRQVAALARNFGSSYSSDELTFGAAQEPTL